MSLDLVKYSRVVLLQIYLGSLYSQVRIGSHSLKTARATGEMWTQRP